MHLSLWFIFWVNLDIRKICWRKERLPPPVFLGFPGGSDGKESTCNVGDLGSIPGLGRSRGEGKGYPLQYSGPENSVHEVAKSWTRVNNFHFHFFVYGTRYDQLLLLVFIIEVLNFSSTICSKPRGMWDLSSWNKDLTHTFCIKRWSLNQWATWEVWRKEINSWGGERQIHLDAWDEWAF